MRKTGSVYRIVNNIVTGECKYFPNYKTCFIDVHANWNDVMVVTEFSTF